MTTPVFSPVDLGMQLPSHPPGGSPGSLWYQRVEPRTPAELRPSGSLLVGVHRPVEVTKLQHLERLEEEDPKVAEEAPPPARKVVQEHLEEEDSQ